MRKRSHSAPAKRGSRSPAARSGRAPARAGRRNRTVASREKQAAQSDALTLPVECTLADADGLKLRLAALLRSPEPVTVDVSGVRRIDTASLQLIAAFARDRRSSELAVKVSGDSDAFAEGMRLLGLTRILGAAD
jgi:anti-anti-sigma regulatory factor